MKRFVYLFLLLTLVLSACGAPAVTPTTDPTGQETAVEETPLVTPTATEQPPKVLNVCTSSLPENLFPYDVPQTQVEENILALIQDPVFELVDGELQPILLQQVPTFENSGIRLEAVTVQGGQTVVDARGELVVMKQGVSYRPSGCRQADCAITWDGQTPVEMDQMSIEFEFKEGLNWSDGTPLTAADSVFSFKLASDPGAPGLSWEEERTSSYTALNEDVLRWVGKPGFAAAEISRFFWNPLPAHLFEANADWAQISGSGIFSSALPGYGPFVIASFDEHSLVFDRNPQYFRAEEGLPYLDTVVFNVIDGGPEGAWSALQAGECDVLDSSFDLSSSPEIMAAAEADQGVRVRMALDDTWTQLVFGIKPASYDDGYHPAFGDRPDFFGDQRTRQAVAACLNRELAMLEMTMNGLGAVWHSFLPPGESMLDVDNQISYDPEAAAQRLFDAGWRDHDNNPDTPLQAWEVSSVPAGTLFSISLLINPSGFHRDLAEIIQNNLQSCGIEVTITELPAEERYAPGPQGPLFGRRFDLALLSWQPLPELDCSYYQSWQIPSAENQWIGTNAAGLSDAAFDNACSTANLSLPGDLSSAVQQAEQTYAAVLPAVPLLSRARIMIEAPAGCHQIEPTTETNFFSLLEYYDLNFACP